MQFNLVICGLDSVEARRWINATLVNMVDSDNPESLKPLIDGGTEGGLTTKQDLYNADTNMNKDSRARRALFSQPSHPATNALSTC